MKNLDLKKVVLTALKHITDESSINIYDNLNQISISGYPTFNKFFSNITVSGEKQQNQGFAISNLPDQYYNYKITIDGVLSEKITNADFNKIKLLAIETKNKLSIEKSKKVKKNINLFFKSWS